jgi:hypothetical protein
MDYLLSLYSEIPEASSLTEDSQQSYQQEFCSRESFELWRKLAALVPPPRERAME